MFTVYFIDGHSLRYRSFEIADAISVLDAKEKFWERMDGDFDHEITEIVEHLKEV